MSRIGKQPITVPSAVKVDIDGRNIKVTGPRGTLSREVVPEVRRRMEARRPGHVPSDPPTHASLKANPDSPHFKVRPVEEKV